MLKIEILLALFSQSMNKKIGKNLRKSLKSSEFLTSSFHLLFCSNFCLKLCLSDLQTLLLPLKSQIFFSHATQKLFCMIFTGVISLKTYGSNIQPSANIKRTKKTKIAFFSNLTLILYHS